MIMTVSQLSMYGGVTSHVVRYYARIGLLKPQRDPGNGYKLFSSADVDRLHFIRKAQSLGYTLGEIRNFLALRGSGQGSCAEARAILEQRLAASGEHMRELVALQRRMRRALRLWGKLSAELADVHDVCGLIEGTVP